MLWKRAWPWFLLVFLLPWSAATLFMDFCLALGVFGQLRAVAFPTVEGEVVKCQVVKKDTGEGIAYDVDVEYTYQVDNRPYSSTQVRTFKIWGEGSASRFVAAHPPNSRVLVYYDPANPAFALLTPGVGGAEQYMLLFALPFNMGMIGLCWALAGCCTGRLFVGKDGSFHQHFRPRTWERGDEIRIRLPAVSPALAALVFFTFGPVPVLLAAPCCCVWMPPSIPSATVMLVVWAIVLGGGVALYLTMAMPIARGKADLVIDRGRKTITLPRTCGRREVFVVPIVDITTIAVAQVQKSDHDGVKYSYITMLSWFGAYREVRQDPLAEWCDAQQAEALAAWVRAAVGMPIQDPI